MDGRATLTIDTSSTTMNCATHASASTTASGTCRRCGSSAPTLSGPVSKDMKHVYHAPCLVSSSLFVVTADPSTSEAHRQPGPGRLSFQDRTGYLLARAGWLSRHRWASMIGEFDINPSQYKALICL